MRLLLSPDWFLSADVIIELISFCVLILFFVFAIKSYKLNKNKNSLYLGIGFLIIAVAEVSIILTKLVGYYDLFFAQAVGQFIVTYKVVHSVDIFYYIGFFMHKILTLTGLYIIYRLPLKKRYFSDVVLGIFFIILSAYFGIENFFLFHITVILLLAFILINYYSIYEKNKSENTKLLMIAFGTLMFGHILFILSNIPDVYVIGQLCQLASYLILAMLMIKIFWYNKKEYG